MTYPIVLAHPLSRLLDGSTPAEGTEPYFMQPIKKQQQAEKQE